MTSYEPTDSYLVGGAALPVSEAPSSFEYDRARDFQRNAVNWIEDGDEPVALLSAPTGGGKTAVIAALAATSDRTLCLYPTNALANAQQKTLEQVYDLEVDVLTGETLTERGDARSQEVLQYATTPGGGDVVLTNPDVLQAILQNQYFSPGSEILRFFAHFDAAVYDEFHYYDPLGASGLLMQIKVLSERGRYRTREGSLEFPRVLLPSATPSSAFVDHLEEDLDLPATRIRATLVPLDVEDAGPTVDVQLAYRSRDTEGEHLVSPTAVRQPTGPHDEEAAEDTVAMVPDDYERFRYPMVVNRWDWEVEESFALIADLLERGVGLDENEQPTGRAAVIFNSAARSNQFHEYLLEQEMLGAVSVKDNGYDTAGDDSLPEDFAILNTTSKGEVGLDFDLDRLVMITPFTASDFVQRIGRAARHSPSIVDVFELDDPLWPSVQSYPAFLQRVANTIEDPNVNRNHFRDLLGLRAGRALHHRFEQEQYHAEEIWEDFAGFPNQSKWRTFLAHCSDAFETASNNDDPFGPSLDRPTAKVLRTINAALQGLDSLRGRSIQHRIRYPVGDRREQTEYDIVTALRHYPIETVEDDTVILGHGSVGRRVGHYPGSPSEGRGIDLTHSQYAVDRQLRRNVTTLVEAATWRDTELDDDVVKRFFEVLNLGSALLPETVETTEYQFVCSERGDVEKIQSEGQ